MANLFRCAGGGEDIKCIERPYDISKTYNAGDTVLYNGLLRICTANGVTGDFNENKWKVTTLEELLGENAGESGTFVDYIASEYDPTHTYTAGDAILGDNGEILKCLEDDVTGGFDNSKWSRDYLCNLSGNVNSDSAPKCLTFHSVVNVKNSKTVTVPTACLKGSALIMQFSANNVSSALTINGTDATNYADYWNTTGNAEYSGYGNATFRYFVINLDGSTSSLAFSRDWNNGYCDVAIIFFEEQMGTVECLAAQYATNKTYTCEEGYQYITIGMGNSGYIGSIGATGKFVVSHSRYSNQRVITSLTNYCVIMDVRTLINKCSGVINVSCGSHDTVFVLRYKL